MKQMHEELKEQKISEKRPREGEKARALALWQVATKMTFLLKK